jgi:putative transposase
MLTLDHFLILSERHLHRVMKEYQEYFNRARPHRGIGQRIPCQLVRGAGPQMIGELIYRLVLGGLHQDYHRPSHERSSYARAA